MLATHPPKHDAQRKAARASRQEYWLTLGAALLALLALRSFGAQHTSGAFTGVLLLMQIRRAHDFGRTGWWAAIYPMIYWVALTRPADAAARPLLTLAMLAIIVVFGAIPGDAGENRFGPPRPRLKPIFTRR